MTETRSGQTVFPEKVKRARVATSLLFIVDGAGFGIWAALLPSLQARHVLSEAELAGAMLGMVVGAVVAMVGIGRILARCGSSRVLGIVAPLFTLALCGPAISPTYASVVLAAAAFGVFKGAFDVSVNTQALTVERAAARPIMASFQACWSFGGLGAALLAGSALKLGASPLVLTLSSAAILFAVGCWCSGRLVEEPVSAVSEKRGSVFDSSILPVGVLAFVALFTEGVMMDWSAVYAANVSGARDWLAPLAYGAFCSAMAFGRLVGDRLVSKMGANKLLRLGGVLTVSGLILIVCVREWPATFAGLLVVGLGLSNLVPIFLKAAGAVHPSGPAQGVAAVSSVGYVGFLAGPPLIGWLSSCVGLPLAFTVVALLASLIAIQGPNLVNMSRSLRPTRPEIDAVVDSTIGGEKVVS